MTQTIVIVGASHASVQAIDTLRREGHAGPIVLVGDVDAFGPALEAAGFEIVYEASYPLGTQDVAPIISQAKAATPDAFVGFSYPPDTFALTEQAQIQGLDVGAFYVGVGTSFPGYAARFGAVADGVLGAGGTNPDDPKIAEYRAKHLEVTGAEADYWASAVTYSGLQVLEQAIEAAGTKDRAAVIEAIRTGTFDTVMGTISFTDNVNRSIWTVGQWEDGVFHGVAANGLEGARPPVAKAGWE